MSTATHTQTTIADAYARAWATERSGQPRAALRPRSVTRGKKRLLQLLAYVVLGFSIGIALAVTAPLAFGFKSFTVLSGSMEPVIRTGDVIVVKRISASDARIGDVVSFRLPEDPNRILSHRVTRIRAADGAIAFVTQGDANTGVERWQVPADGTIGRVEFHIPKLGYITNRVGSPFGKLAFLVLPAVLLAASELYRIWRPRPRTSGDAARE